MPANVQDFQNLYDLLSSKIDGFLGPLSHCIEDIYGPEKLGYRDLTSHYKIPAGHYSSKAQRYADTKRYEYVHNIGEAVVNRLTNVNFENSEQELYCFKNFIQLIADELRIRFHYPELPDEIRQSLISEIGSTIKVIDDFQSEHGIKFPKKIIIDEEIKAFLKPLLRPSYEELDSLLVQALDIYLDKHSYDLTAHSDRAIETLEDLQHAYRSLVSFTKNKFDDESEYSVSKSSFKVHSHRTHPTLVDLRKIAGNSDFSEISEPLYRAINKLEEKFNEIYENYPSDKKRSVILPDGR